MNLDSLHDNWLRPSYSLYSLSKLVQQACNVSNFSQLVTSPTRIQYNSIRKATSISCIDHLYCNYRSRCSMVTMIPFGSSDHNLLSYTRFSKEPVPHSRMIRKRSYKNFVKEDFIGDLSKIDWTPVLACQDIDTAESLFTELFCQILDKHAPWVCFQEKKNYVPWITEETLSLIKKRDLLKHEAQKLALGRKNGQISQTEIEIWNNFKKSKKSDQQ